MCCLMWLYWVSVLLAGEVWHDRGQAEAGTGESQVLSGTHAAQKVRHPWVDDHYPDCGWDLCHPLWHVLEGALEPRHSSVYNGQTCCSSASFLEAWKAEICWCRTCRQQVGYCMLEPNQVCQDAYLIIRSCSITSAVLTWVIQLKPCFLNI